MCLERGLRVLLGMVRWCNQWLVELLNVDIVIHNIWKSCQLALFLMPHNDSVIVDSSSVKAVLEALYKEKGLGFGFSEYYVFQCQS